MSRRATRAAWLAAIVLAQAACTEPSAAPAVASAARPLGQAAAGPATPVASAAPTPQTAAVPPTGAMREPPAARTPEYAARGRRDPFEPVPPSRPETAEPAARRRALIASAKLTGIVWGVEGPLALVEMQDGIGYVLRPGDGIGDGRLIQIGRDSVLFDIDPKPGLVSERIVLALERAR